MFQLTCHTLHQFETGLYYINIFSVVVANLEVPPFTADTFIYVNVLNYLLIYSGVAYLAGQWLEKLLHLLFHIF